MAAGFPELQIVQSANKNACCVRRMFIGCLLTSKHIVNVFEVKNK